MITYIAFFRVQMPLKAQINLINCINSFEREFIFINFSLYVHSQLILSLLYIN